MVFRNPLAGNYALCWLRAALRRKEENYFLSLLS
jgi:hypothetical protein